MEVYRITHNKFASKLTASGRAARWNSNAQFLIYTASSRSLACLENLVHRSGVEGKNYFKLIIINIPAEITHSLVRLKDLDKDWSDYKNLAKTQRLGDKWLLKKENLILKVPSAIIPEEFNYLIDPAHPQFSQIKIIRTEDFIFDDRL